MDGFSIPEWFGKSFKGGKVLEHKIFPAEVKGFDDDSLIVEHFISTEKRDRGGDVMKADGMRVRGKVVVLMAHGFSGMGQEPIAKPLKIWPDTFRGSPGICARTQFYDGSHLTPPDNTGRRLYDKTKNGYLPNWSIGWIPIKWNDSQGPHGEHYRDVLEWELLEYSPVGVPMNPDCQTADADKCQHGNICQRKSWFKVLPAPQFILTKAFSDYRPLIDPEAIKETIEELKCFLGRGYGWCTLKELPAKIEEINVALIRREIRRVRGKVD